MSDLIPLRDNPIKEAEISEGGKQSVNETMSESFEQQCDLQHVSENPKGTSIGIQVEIFKESVSVETQTDVFHEKSIESINSDTFSDHHLLPMDSEDTSVVERSDVCSQTSSSSPKPAYRKKLFPTSSSSESKQSDITDDDECQSSGNESGGNSANEGFGSLSDDSSAAPNEDNEPSKRKYDKRHYCFYCYASYSRLSGHFLRKHINESQVADIATTKDKRERQRKVSKLVKLGDFNHNLHVITSKQGELIVARRGVELADSTNFLPCPNCLGFYKKKLLWKHSRKCSGETESEEARKNVLKDSNAIVNSFLNPMLNKDFATHIVNNLRSDTEGLTVRNDRTILQFGYDLFENHGASQATHIRQSMRQLGRLVMAMSEGEDEIITLESVLKPEAIEDILTAVRALCEETRTTTNKPTFGKPSLALKLGYHLRSCAALLRGNALSKGHMDQAKTLKYFISLLDTKYSKKISSGALNTLYQKKKIATDCLPLTADLLKLTAHVDGELKTLSIRLETNPTSFVWTKLANTVLARIILFNKRRSGEASQMTVADYDKKTIWNDAVKNKEIEASLSEFEISVASSLQLIKITGKRGRIVPVLLTKDVIKPMNLLMRYRRKAGVDTKNTYFFAVPSQASLKHMRGGDALRRTINSCEELENPGQITSTKLRKYIATVTQILNVKENEVDWLARHLGHDIQIHRNFYRLHDNAVEMAKVSVLLMAAERGQLSKWAGKNIEEIALQDLPPIEDDIDLIEDNEADTSLLMENDAVGNSPETGEMETPSKAGAGKHIREIALQDLPPIEGGIDLTEDNEADPSPLMKNDVVDNSPATGEMKTPSEAAAQPSTSNYQPSISKLLPSQQRRVTQKKINEELEDTNWYEENKDLYEENKKKAERKPVKRNVWSSPAKKHMRDYFETSIKYGVVPRKDAIEECMRDQPRLFQNTEWRRVKWYINDCIRKMHSRKKKSNAQN